MKILLTTLNSKYIHSCLALKYLYESSGPYQDEIEVREFTINNDDVSIFMELMRGDYDVYCFSCYIWNITRTLGLIRDLKAARRAEGKACVIVVGGPEVSFETEALLERCPEIDFVIRGEGEKPFRQLLERLQETGPGAEGVASALVGMGQNLISSERIFGPEPCTPEEIPFPYETRGFDPEKIIYYESSRGCPFQCSFCLSSTEKRLRFLPLERVKRELDLFLSNRVKQVKFIDRTFNADTDRAAEILQYIVDHDNGISNFHLELCGDRISDEMFDAFEEARSGLFQLEIGVQSTCEEALEACGRQMDFEELAENVRRLRSFRTIHLHLDLIAGLPGETYDRFQQSFDDVYELEPDDLQLGFLKMIKGSRIREEADLYGYRFRDREPYEIIGNHDITPGELVKLKEVEHVLELYYNQPGFRNTLHYVIHHFYESPFSFYRELSKYFFQKGYQNSAQSKDKLYGILEAFLESKGFAPQKGIRELLRYDKAATASGSVVTDKSMTAMVHDQLHGMIQIDQKLKAELKGLACGSEPVSKEEGTTKTIKVKDWIKSVNYGLFTYNVSDYRYGYAEDLEEEGDTLCIFFSDRKDAGGMALETSVPII